MNYQEGIRWGEQPVHLKHTKAAASPTVAAITLARKARISLRQ
jgi:hypothetical protein